MLKFLRKYVNRDKLDLAYTVYIRPHFEYGGVIFHGSAQYLSDNIESVQYQAGLIVAGCWKKNSRVKLYSELGWESLSERRIFRRLCLYYKIKNGLTPPYLRSYLLDSPPTGTARFLKSFFPFCYNIWPTVDPLIRNSTSLAIFKSRYIACLRPPKSKTYAIHDKSGIPLLTRLRVEHSDLRSHRYPKNFNCPSPTCKCGFEHETPAHYFLRCQFFIPCRRTLLNSISFIANDIQNLPHDQLTKLLLYGSPSLDDNQNTSILKASIIYRFKKNEAFSHS